MGNAAYEGSGKLKYPGDADDDVAAKLEASGFSVVKKDDCSNADLDRINTIFLDGDIRFKTGWPDACHARTFATSRPRPSDAYVNWL